MSTIDEETLARALASVGRHLDTDATSAAQRPEPHHRLLMAAAAVIITILVGLAVTPVRTTVADWLGIGSTSVVHVPATGAPSAGLPPSAPSTSPAPITNGLSAIDAADAVRRLGRPLPDTSLSELGPPQALEAMPEGGVLMVWADGASTLWVHAAEVSAQVLVKKLIGTDQPARFISGIGDGALAITGAHVLVTPHRTIAARTVLLWTDATMELRLESDLPLERMITIAQQLS
jgi:hypothetical protein